MSSITSRGELDPSGAHELISVFMRVFVFSKHSLCFYYVCVHIFVVHVSVGSFL